MKDFSPNPKKEGGCHAHLGALSTITSPVTDSRMACRGHSGDGVVVGRGGRLGHCGHSGSRPGPVVGGIGGR